MDDVELGARYSLPHNEQVIARWLAELRQRTNERNRIRNRRRGHRSDLAFHLDGVGGEFAFTALFGGRPDFTTHSRGSAQDRGDLRVGGLTVDVKATTYRQGCLTANPWKVAPVDLFALMVGEFPAYEFRGFMRAAELLQPWRIGDLGHGPAYIASQAELRTLGAIRLELWYLSEYPDYNSGDGRGPAVGTTIEGTL